MFHLLFSGILLLIPYLLLFLLTSLLKSHFFTKPCWSLVQEIKLLQPPPPLHSGGDEAVLTLPEQSVFSPLQVMLFSLSPCTVVLQTAFTDCFLVKHKSRRVRQLYCIVVQQFGFKTEAMINQS